MILINKMKTPFKLIILYFGLFLTGCSSDIAEDDINILPGDVKKEILKGIEILYSDSAKVKIRVTGAQMDRILDPDNPREEFSKGLFIEFFDNRGNLTSTLKADYGIRYQNKSDVLARGNVVMKSIKNESMETDEMIWDRDKEKVYTRKFVLVKTAKETFWGQGFESNQDFTQWHIKGLEGHINADKFEKGVK